MKYYTIEATPYELNTKAGQSWSAEEIRDAVNSKAELYPYAVEAFEDEGAALEAFRAYEATAREYATNSGHVLSGEAFELLEIDAQGYASTPAEALEAYEAGDLIDGFVAVCAVKWPNYKAEA